MSPLQSLANMPPSPPTANADAANQALDQPQDPSQARFADILRQRQGASPAPGKAARETPPADTPVDTKGVTSIAAQVPDGAGERLTDLALGAATPDAPLDPAQLPPLWTPPLATLRPAVPETLATSILAQRIQADALANPVASRQADPTARLLEAGAGNSASRGVEMQPGNGRGLRADASGLRMAALQVASSVDQPAALAQAGASAGGEARPNGIALDALPARTDTLAWGATPLQAEASATRNAGPAPHSVSVEARVGTPRFADETAQQVTWLAKNGIEHAEIRVKPADLGPISVRIEMQNNEAVISFAVTQPETRVAVEDALHRLQEMLAESGISMGETSVGGQSFGQQLRGDRETSRNRHTFAARGEMPASAIEAMSARRQPATRGLVDTFA